MLVRPETTQLRVSGTVVRTMVRGTPIRFFVVNPQDHIQSVHARGEFYEPEELTMISKHCPRHARILDIGANIGNHTIFFDKFLEPESVRVFEVNPVACEILDINLRLNRCASVDTGALGIALSDANVPLGISVEYADNLAATQFQPDAGGKFRAATGDSLVGGAPVHFMKIDVERMEIQVLQGLESTIRTWQPTMFVEVSDQCRADFDTWLAGAGYQVVESFTRYIDLINVIVKPVTK